MLLINKLYHIRGQGLREFVYVIHVLYNFQLTNYILQSKLSSSSYRELCRLYFLIQFSICESFTQLLTNVLNQLVG